MWQAIRVVVLRKMESNTTRQIEYRSLSFNNVKKRYNRAHRKCLAIVWSIQILRLFLEGTQFSIRTGHDFLTRIPNSTKSTTPHGRLRLRLAEHDFGVSALQGGHIKSNHLRVFLSTSDQKWPDASQKWLTSPRHKRTRIWRANCLRKEYLRQWQTLLQASEKTTWCKTHGNRISIWTESP